MAPLDSTLDDALERASDALRRANDILFITGAGLSADSGLPTYRGIGGLYQDRLTDEGLPIEVVLSGQMMRTSPETTWRYIAEIEAQTRGAEPNRGHHVIAEIEREKPRVWTLTQNVEGLHRRAGSRKLIEIHGDIHRLICTSCGLEERVESWAGLEIPPHCPVCAEILRPAVVLFNEALPPAAVLRLHEELERGFDLVFSIGTTSAFPYIAGPVLEAAARGVTTIEINPGWSEVSDAVELRIEARAAEALDALWARAKP